MSILAKKGRLYMQAFSRTVEGMTISDGPVVSDDGSDISFIGAKVLQVLDLSTVNVRQPKNQQEWLTVQKPMLEAVGAKSWATMARGAKCIGLTFDGKIVEIEPSINYGNEGGTSLPDRALRVPPIPDAIGRAVMAAFELST
jgi:hypothetical protein